MRRQWKVRVHCYLGCVVCRDSGVASSHSHAFVRRHTVNFFGLLRVCQAFIPLLRAQALARRHVGASRILNLTSLAGTVPTMPGLSAYAASKRAAQAVSEALRYELAGFGIQVGTWCPSFHDTDMVVGASALMDGQWDKLSAHKKKDIYGEGECNWTNCDLQQRQGCHPADVGLQTTFDNCATVSSKSRKRSGGTAPRPSNSCTKPWWRNTCPAPT